MSIGNKLAILLLLPTLAWAHAPNGPSGVNINGLSIARKPFVQPFPSTVVEVTPIPPSYQGPGDLVPGATVWYGLRAYTAAYASASGQLIRLHRLSDDQQCDVLAANDGGFGLTANCPQTGNNGQTTAAFCNTATCVVVALYDQTVGNNCAGTCDFQQRIVSSQPTLTFTCLGLLPCITLVGVQQFATAAALTLAQPLTVIVAASYTGSNMAETLAASGNEVQVGFNAFSADDIYVTAGSLAHVSGNTTNTFHAIQFVASDPAASALEIDGTATSLAAGPNGFASPITLGAMVGQFVEGGIWPSSLTLAQRTALNGNMHGYWGF